MKKKIIIPVVVVVVLGIAGAAIAILHLRRATK